MRLGSPAGEEGRDDDEGPVHEVCVDGFWLGKYEVTQGEWEKVMGSNPLRFKKDERYPVEQVSWDDVQVFVGRLGSGFRLPTEAEWEYAARGGTTGARFGDLDAIAWHYGNSGGKPYPVGEKSPNAYGLYDMLGNVWEWTGDWFGGYPSGSQRNPTGAGAGTDRVNRGCGWNCGPRGVRAALRFGNTPSGRYVSLGFRLLSTKAQTRRMGQHPVWSRPTGPSPRSSRPEIPHRRVAGRIRLAAPGLVAERRTSRDCLSRRLKAAPNEREDRPCPTP
ncbi:MAG: formylglycine-generating enzyme family protein [Candidatus Schekmanbacteria bacterium]|nr:formylglycine-generating enzyme family protein [Candidatus Schekmanbacteria bacterium]